MNSEEYMTIRTEAFLDERKPVEQNIILYGLLKQQILINKELSRGLKTLQEQLDKLNGNSHD